MIDTDKLKRSFEVSLNFSDNAARDLCFAAVYFAALKDYDAAYGYLTLAAENAPADENIVTTALRLWAACRVQPGINITELISILTDKIESNYASTDPHWLYGEYSGIYLSNLSVIYAALQGASAITNSDKARQWVIRLRDYAFKNFLRGGYLVSTEDSSIRYGDLTVCAVPFCMFCPEDRVLVEAMEEEQKRFFPENNEISFFQGQQGNRELTLLSAWYFAEKGDMKKGDLARARALYNTSVALKGSNGKEAFGLILSVLVEHILNLRENQGTEMKVIHAPIGTGDPYYHGQNERVPRLPLDGDTVRVNAEVVPFYGDYKVQLEYSINDNNTESITMDKITAENKAEYYTALIGNCRYGDYISYRITASDAEKHVQSGNFTYKPAKWFECRNILGAKASTDNMAIYFKADKQSGIAVVMTINADGDTLMTKLDFSKENVNNGEIGFGTFRLGESDIKVEADGICFNDRRLEKIFYLCNSDEVIMARLSLRAEPGERFYGMGERFSAIEYRGCRLENYVYNQYRDQGMKTYMPCPFYISSEGYGLYLDSSAYSVFDFCAADPDTVSIEGYCSSGRQEMQLFTGSPKAILAAYIRRTGLPELPPVWAFGPWMSSNNWDSQKEVLYQLEMAKKYRIPATVLVIEQWSDEATFYIFNDAGYKLREGSDRFCESDFDFPQWGRWHDPRAMVDKLHDEGIKVLLWQAPFQKYMGGVAHPQRDEDERVMIEKGYCVKNEDGTPYRVPYGWFSGSLIPDFTNPEAVSWWLDKRRYLLEDIGIDGFKTDGGECIMGDELIFFNGADGRTMHNLYVLEYVSSYHQYARRFREESVTFSRAGFTGAQRMPLHWAGDERSTWEAFRASMRAGLSSGLSGIIFWGWDLAGFHGDTPSAELYIRSAQMAAFCPVMQYHAETKGEFNRDRTPWNIADRTGDMRALSIYRDYSVLRMNLLPYIYSEAVRCASDCEPLMRGMVYDFPDDSECRDIEMQYMFGRSMLVAPVCKEGNTSTVVYLPKGRWYGMFDNKLYDTPGYYDVESPINVIPVFVKDNSIIPLNLDGSLQLFSYVGNEAGCFRNLCLDIRLMDEITECFDFGKAGKAEIDVSRSEDSIKVHVSANQPVILRFMNESKPESVFMGKERLSEKDVNNCENRSIWNFRNNHIIVISQSSNFDLSINFIQ